MPQPITTQIQSPTSTCTYDPWSCKPIPLVYEGSIANNISLKNENICARYKPAISHRETWSKSRGNHVPIYVIKQMGSNQTSSTGIRSYRPLCEHGLGAFANIDVLRGTASGSGRRRLCFLHWHGFAPRLECCWFNRVLFSRVYIFIGTIRTKVLVLGD